MLEPSHNVEKPLKSLKTLKVSVKRIGLESETKCLHGYEIKDLTINGKKGVVKE